jgi:cytochrome c
LCPLINYKNYKDHALPFQGLNRVYEILGEVNQVKIFKTVLLFLISVTLVISFAFAAGNVEKGKALFNDPKAFGGLRACSSCHPDGKGLEGAAEESEWITPAGSSSTLAETINLCIVNASKGKAIDPKSQGMQDLIAYIKSL